MDGTQCKILNMYKNFFVGVALLGNSLDLRVIAVYDKQLPVGYCTGFSKCCNTKLTVYVGRLSSRLWNCLWSCWTQWGWSLLSNVSLPSLNTMNGCGEPEKQWLKVKTKLLLRGSPATCVCYSLYPCFFPVQDILLVTRRGAAGRQWEVKKYNARSWNEGQ